jgi:hypothetical protein
LGRSRTTKIKGRFFEKKRAKTFCEMGHGPYTGTGQTQRSFFCFFFVHKKEDSLLSF